MDNYIKVYDNVLDELSCKELIKRFENFYKDYHTVHVENEDNVIAFEQIILNDHEEWKEAQNALFEVFKHYIINYKIDCNINDEFWPETHGFETVRIKRYLNNDYDRFDPHVDVLDYASARRFLAFFVYLNDVDEGGETVFTNIHKPGTYLPYTIEAKRGRMLMFPPTWTYQHAGKKPISSPKYIAHSYCHYV